MRAFPSPLALGSRMHESRKIFVEHTRHVARDTVLSLGLIVLRSISYGPNFNNKR